MLVAAAAVVAVAAEVATAPAGAKEWSQWWGPNRDGISAEAGWATDLTDRKPAWQLNVGTGYSAVSVSNGRVYTIGNADGTDTVWCLDAATGKEVWKHSYKCPPAGAGHPGPRCTPAVADGAVYTLSAEGHFFCLDADSGKVLWAKDARKDLGASAGQWGLACSPLILGKAVVVDVGTVVALDRRTGQLLWKSRQHKAGYSSPKPFRLNNKEMLAVFSGEGLMILDAATGQELGGHPWKTAYDVNASMPAVLEDKIFITSGYGTGCALVQITPGGLKELWRNKEMASHFASPVLVDGCLYGYDGQVGSGSLKCMDFQTGQVKWSQKSAGSLMLADGKLILLETRGKLAVAEASPEAYKELGSTNLGRGTWWNMPVLSGGRIYCRSHEGQLVCVDVSK